ncbi:MAG: hypothetical protein ACRDWI_17650 [Jiangellaceae bacterium]
MDVGRPSRDLQTRQRQRLGGVGQIHLDRNPRRSLVGKPYRRRQRDRDPQPTRVGDPEHGLDRTQAQLADGGKVVGLAGQELQRPGDPHGGLQRDGEYLRALGKLYKTGGRAVVAGSCERVAGVGREADQRRSDPPRHRQQGDVAVDLCGGVEDRRGLLDPVEPFERRGSGHRPDHRDGADLRELHAHV